MVRQGYTIVRLPVSLSLRDDFIKIALKNYSSISEHVRTIIEREVARHQSRQEESQDLKRIVEEQEDPAIVFYIQRSLWDDFKEIALATHSSRYEALRELIEDEVINHCNGSTSDAKIDPSSQETRR